MADVASNNRGQPKIAYEPPDEERPASATPSAVRLDYEPAPPRHDPYAALRHRSYVIFAGGWLISVIGHQVTTAALGWELYDRLRPVNETQAKLALGWMAGIQAIPLLLLALPAGALADVWDRRRIIQVTAALAAIFSGALAWLSYQPGSIPLMYGALLLLSTMQTIGRPARSALLPQIVPTRVFSNAVTWQASVFQVAAMVGPALAGFVIHQSLKRYGSLAVAYLIDAGATLTFAMMMFAVPPQKNGSPAAAGRAVPEPVLSRLTAGLRFVFRTKIILATITLDLLAVLLGGAVVLLPAFARDILKVGSQEFGWLRAAEAIGAICMGMLIAHLPPMKQAGRAMLWAVAAFGAATVVFGLSRNYYMSLAMLFLIGAFDNVSVVVRHTLVQVLTPDHMRGRVSAVNNIFIGASNELGGLESGLTAAAMGLVGSVVFGGLGTIVTVIVVGLLWPQVRRFGSLAEARSEPS